MKAETKEDRAAVIDHFIKIAMHSLVLKNFHAIMEIMTALQFDFIVDLKSTWKVRITGFRFI